MNSIQYYNTDPGIQANDHTEVIRFGDHAIIVDISQPDAPLSLGWILERAFQPAPLLISITLVSLSVAYLVF